MVQSAVDEIQVITDPPADQIIQQGFLFITVFENILQSMCRLSKYSERLVGGRKLLNRLM